MKSIDITREHCPMTFVKVKLAIEELSIGERIDVKLAAGEPVENVPRAAEDEGHTIVEIRPDGMHFHVIIEKA